MTELQLQDTQDIEIMSDLELKIYKKLFLWWKPVATGKVPHSPWKTGQSTDCLTFFSNWCVCFLMLSFKLLFHLLYSLPFIVINRILLVASDEIYQFFMRSGLDDITVEINKNVTKYCDDEHGEYYIKGYDMVCEVPKALVLYQMRKLEEIIV